MTEQTITSATRLTALAETATASGAWWKPEALENRSELVLPTRVLRILENAGITTVEQLKAAGLSRCASWRGSASWASTRSSICCGHSTGRAMGKADA